MNTRTVMTVAAVIALVFAIGLLLAPAFMATLYGIGTSPSEILLARYFGAALLAIGLVNWLARNADYASLRPIIFANMVGDFVGVIISVMGTVSGVLSSLGWLSVALYLLLALGFAYLQFMGQPVSVRQRA